MSVDILNYPYKVEIYNKDEIINITDYVISLDLNLSINSLYNTLKISLDARNLNFNLLLSKIRFTYNTLKTEAFIIEMQYKEKKKDIVTLYCRTIGAKLFQPFVENINVIDYAKDTDELIAKYSSLSGVNIINELPNLKLDIGINRGNSIGDALNKIINLFNADFYEKNTNLVLKPKKIQDNNTVKVIDFIEEEGIQYKDTILNNGINKVIISNERDKIIEDDIIADIFEDTGEVRLFAPDNILDRLDNNCRGLVAPFEKLQDTYTQIAILNNNNYFTLQRYAKDIVNITINNSAVEYELKGKAIEFKENHRGILSVEYVSEYQKTYLIPKTINNKRYGDFEVIADDNYLSWFGELGENSLNGNLDYEVVGEPCSNIGFSILIFNNTLPNIYIFKGANKLDTSDKITIIDNYTTDKLEKITLNLNSVNNKYEAKLRFKNPILKKVRVGGQEVTNYTTELRDDFLYIQFDNMQYAVEALYSVDCYKIDIKYPLIPPETLEDYIVLEDKNYNAVININNSSCKDYGCEYPKEYTFNIAKMLNVPIETIKGKTIENLGTINEYGEVSKTYTEDGIFTYDTTHLKDRTKIIFKANVNGTAGNANSSGFNIVGRK